MTKIHRADTWTILLATASIAVRSRLAEGFGDAALVVATDRPTLAKGLVDVEPNVVFVDLALPSLNGVEDVAVLQRLCAAARIVVLAPAPSERQAVFALVAGARGYCQRTIAPALARKAAEVVQRGEIWIGRGVVPHLLRRIASLTASAPAAAPAATPSRALPTRFEFLAPRERQIALLVGSGANNKEIATQLSITEATVKAHLTSVFRKLNVSDRLRLALVVSGQRPSRPLRGARRDVARDASANAVDAADA